MLGSRYLLNMYPIISDYIQLFKNIQLIINHIVAPQVKDSSLLS
jgi:hypothetical protein